MSLTRRTSELSFGPQLDSLGGPLVDAECLRDVGQAEGPSARELQRRLLDTYGEVPASERLPVGQRMAVIIGASAALWAAIGTAIYLAL